MIGARYWFRRFYTAVFAGCDAAWFTWTYHDSLERNAAHIKDATDKVAAAMRKEFGDGFQ